MIAFLFLTMGSDEGSRKMYHVRGLGNVTFRSVSHPSLATCMISTSLRNLLCIPFFKKKTKKKKKSCSKKLHNREKIKGKVA